VAVYLSQATGAPVYLVDYRRAPEVPFPTPIVDGLFSWQQARKHLPAARWVWAGDSAGGGLALAALQRARDLGQGLPLGTVLFSPWTDLTLSGESLVTNKATDPWISPEGLPLLVQSYILQGGLEAEHPLASPLFGNLKGLPPFLLQASRTELLLDDTVRLHERLVAAGVESTLQLWDDQFHAFQILAPALTEAREAIEKVAIFVENLVHTQQ
jgi:acetyl esterase/lipase